MNYYVLYSNETIGGPFTAARLEQLRRYGLLEETTPAAAGAKGTWRPLGEMVPQIAAEAGGGALENTVRSRCLSPGMPAAMTL